MSRLWRVILFPRMILLGRKIMYFSDCRSRSFQIIYSKIGDNSNISKLSWKNYPAVQAMLNRKVLQEFYLSYNIHSPNNARNSEEKDEIKFPKMAKTFLCILSTFIAIVLVVETLDYRKDVTRMLPVFYNKNSVTTKSISYYLHYILSIGGFFSRNMEKQNMNTNSSRQIEWWYDDLINSIDTIDIRKIFPMIQKKVNQHNSLIIPKTSPVILTITQSNLQRENYDANYFPVSVSSNILLSTPTLFRVLPIHESEDAYYNIKRKITNTRFKLHSIDRIENLLLELSYLYKKNQKLKDYPHLEELELFHGTKWIHADSICSFNFNWRFYGKEVGHRYGQGVSFSSNAMYSSNYSDKNINEKVMFIAKVLVGRKCLGSKHLKLPPEGFDTTTKGNDNIVLVKYEDNEFYPLYRIRYHLSPC